MQAILLEAKGQSYHPVTLKFAQPLYDLQSMIYHRIRKPEPVKDRRLLQFLGTEWGRELSPTLWTDLWRQEVRAQLVKSAQLTSVVVLNDDCRYDNEAELVKSLGGKIIAITCSRQLRAKRGELIAESHKSELGISANLIDYSISNEGTKWELNRKLSALLLEL